MTPQRDTDWDLSAGNWSRFVNRTLLRTGISKNGGAWARVGDDFLDGRYDSLEEAQAACLIRVSIMKPRVYLAGKIDQNDWRHELVPHLREHQIDDGPLPTETFVYMGPFFVSCDHGCFHGRNKHGARDGCSEGALTSSQIIRRSYDAIGASDLIFAYITANDCHGTVSEITWALCIGKSIHLAFAPAVNSKDFWFLAKQVDFVYENVTLKRLPLVLNKALTKKKTTQGFCGRMGR